MMDTSLTDKFQHFLHNREDLTDIYYRLHDKLRFQFAERIELNLELRHLHRKLKRLIVARQKSLPERDQWKLNRDIKGIEYNIELIKRELRDLEKIIEDYKDQTRVISRKIKIVFKNQCEIINEIKPSTVEDVG